MEIPAVQPHHHPAVGQACVVSLEISHILELALCHDRPQFQVPSRSAHRRVEEALNPVMEGSSEPQLDAKAKVTNQLIDFQWKLGMAVSSDSCRSLKYPYVAVMLKVADHSGQVKNKSFEMTIPQFQNFYRQFKEIAAIMETV